MFFWCQSCHGSHSILQHLEKLFFVVDSMSAIIMRRLHHTILLYDGHRRRSWRHSIAGLSQPNLKLHALVYQLCGVTVQARSILRALTPLLPARYIMALASASAQCQCPYGPHLQRHIPTGRPSSRSRVRRRIMPRSTLPRDIMKKTIIQ